MGIPRAILPLAFALTSLGCHGQNPSGQTTSNVIIDGNSARPAEPGARHVELTVRDATSAGIGQSLIGRSCMVQFRRDALGMASPAPLGATQEWGGRTSVSGKIIDITDQWLIIEPTESGTRYCIPHDAILMIEIKP